MTAHFTLQKARGLRLERLGLNELDRVRLAREVFDLARIFPLSRKEDLNIKESLIDFALISVDV